MRPGVLALLLGLAGAASAQTVVPTEAGPVRGAQSDGVSQFLGIPYAAPPVGARRFAPPEPPSPWTEPRDATRFGPACPQVARYGLTEASDAEDCLTLNVAVPDGGAGARPVIVWVHGGAFVGGSSNLYPLAPLARETGAVVVSMNYRLGVFGLMTHPAFAAETDGAYALEDQRMALRWVQRNIAAFGGDPRNVTLAGESAGAGSICMHLIAPDATEGLFHRAFVQSAGCAFVLRSREANHRLGQEVAARVGCGEAATALACLRAAGVEALLQAGAAAGGSDLLAYAPSFGTRSVPRQAAEALESGRFLALPTMLGGTRDELRLYVAYDIQAGARITEANYLDALRAVYGTNAEAVAALHPPMSQGSAPATLGTAMSEFHPTVGINHCLYGRSAALIARRAPVWRFEFADRGAPMLGVALPRSPDPGFEIGAGHSAELNYLFPRFSNTSRIDGPDLTGASAELARRMVEMLGSFARDGRPVAAGLPDWRPGEALRLEAGRIAAFDPDAEHHCAFWRRLYPDVLGR